ncbi:hypothetical protein EG328_007058 [Venturia inaequalis]|uniref:Uncharacterized protein n=1 Tax=Venturia inaequalis TaxID=5025 RepID=A0A8H3UFB5_VENIN|nr:hypothetical protein EG328_007058 [Venturia inaequalis]
MVGGMNRDRFWLRYEGFRTHESLSTVYKLDNHLDAWQRPEDVRELQGVLVLVRGLQAQNPLDRLYSLYTILQGFCPGFPKPNYSIAPSTLWASATSAMIQSTRCLDLILDVYHGQGANLPSWSFDWDFQGKHMPWVVPDDLLDQKRPPGSSWDQAPKLELILKPAQYLVLRIKGRIFTKVGKRSVDQNHARSWYRDVHPTLKDPDATREMSTMLDEATRILFEWAIPRAEVESTVSDAAELCRHLIIWAELPEEDAYKAFNTWYPHMRRLQWLPADGKLDEPDDAMPGITRSLLRKHGENLAKHFHDQTCLRRLFRCFFVTEDGRLGDGRYTIREGDLVVLLCWSKVPAIIRPTAEDPSLYTLVSFSYIHGLVDCHAWNLQEEELQEFTLV